MLCRHAKTRQIAYSKKTSDPKDVAQTTAAERKQRTKFEKTDPSYGRPVHCDTVARSIRLTRHDRGALASTRRSNASTLHRRRAARPRGFCTCWALCRYRAASDKRYDCPNYREGRGAVRRNIDTYQRSRNNDCHTYRDKCFMGTQPAAAADGARSRTDQQHFHRDQGTSSPADAAAGDRSKGSANQIKFFR